MTANDESAIRDDDTDGPESNSEIEVADTDSLDISQAFDDIFGRLSSAVVRSDSASDQVGLAVLAQVSGPIPPPEIVKEYDTIIPDGANRIMVMAEKWQDAIIADRQQSRRAERRGQAYAAICVLAILAVAVVGVVAGQWIGSGVSIICLAAVVYAFVRGRD